MNQNNNHDLNYTLALKRLIKYIIKDFDWQSIDEVDAIAIRELDKDEQYAHIEFVDLEGNKLSTPRIYYPHTWRQSYTRHLRVKERAAIERRNSNVLTENRDKFLKELMRVSGITDEKLLKELAAKMAKNRNEGMAEKLGIKLSE